MLRLQTFLLSGVLLFSGSCGSWSGNPPSSKVETGTTGTVTNPVETTGTVEIVLQGTGTSLQKNTLSVSDKNGNAAGQIVLTSVQMQLGSIALRKSSGQSAAVLAGPFQLDLLTNVVSPKLDKLTLPIGDYQDLRLNLYKGSGSSIILNGTYIAANQASSAVKIALDAQDEIAFLTATEAKAITVTADGSSKVVLSFKLNQWFNFKGKDSDLSAYAGKDLTIDGSTAASDQALRQAFLSNVKAATDFDKSSGSGDDKDNDHPHLPGRGRK